MKNVFWTPGRGRKGPMIQDLFLNLNLVHSESLYYVLYFSTNLIFVKTLLPEIWAKMLSVNQIAGFLNQLYLQNKQLKKPDFLHVDTDSWKLKIIWKILWWAWSKMGVATLVSGLIFCMLIQIQESCFNNFGFAWSKLGEALQTMVLQVYPTNDQMN